jgi:hypothetical protein
MPKLTNISFPALQSITGVLSLTANSYSPNSLITDLNGFSTLTSVAGVTISYFKELKNFEPLKNVIPNLESGTWKITGCGYNPTLRDVKEGKYSN